MPFLSEHHAATGLRRAVPLAVAFLRAPAAAAASEEAGPLPWRRQEPTAEVAAACKLVRARAPKRAAWPRKGAILADEEGRACNTCMSPVGPTAGRGLMQVLLPATITARQLKCRSSLNTLSKVLRLYSQSLDQRQGCAD